MKIFIQKYKINIVSKNEIANSNHDLRRELLSKKFVQLRNFIEDLFEITTSTSRKIETSRSKRVKRTFINFKNIRVETKKNDNSLYDSY